MKTLIVDEKYDNKKLNIFLLAKFDGLSVNTIYKALRKKDIRINDIKVNQNAILHKGDEIKIFIVDDLLYSSNKLKFEIIYEDENILVLDKPSGIEITGDNSISSYLEKKYDNSIFPCHRLDRNTSGIVLFAKNQVSLNILLNSFKNKEIEKHYRCITCNIPKKSEDLLKAYLFKDSKKSIVYISDKKQTGYQEIITSYKILEKDKDKNLAFLDVTLHTGKTHQIRAHLAHINCPILGDGKYGINKINQKFNIKTQLLSSYSITFHFKEKNELYYLNNKTFKLKKLNFDIKKI